MPSAFHQNTKTFVAVVIIIDFLHQADTYFLFLKYFYYMAVVGPRVA
jgi:hypothetical protein